MKKIMFNDKYGLTSAVLNGKKTMTRRIILNEHRLYDDLNAANKLYIHKDNTLRIDFGNCIERKVIIPYKVCEVVAVAQSYKSIDKEILKQGLPLDLKDEVKHHKGYNNKMFVKADDMPHRIRISDIKVERLQDISDEDCLKEGVFKWGDPFHEDRVEDFGFFGATKHYMTARGAFAALIDKVSGKGTWDSNPWVFAYSFELLE